MTGRPTAATAVLDLVGACEGADALISRTQLAEAHQQNRRALVLLGGAVAVLTASTAAYILLNPARRDACQTFTELVQRGLAGDQPEKEQS